MKIATWNVNSIRSRADRVAAWLQRSDVDVVAPGGGPPPTGMGGPPPRLRMSGKQYLAGDRFTDAGLKHLAKLTKLRPDVPRPLARVEPVEAWSDPGALRTLREPGRR